MMKQHEVLKKIGSIINELSEQYQYLQAEEFNLNSLELELFVANAHFLTDHAEILRKISNTQPLVKELVAHTVTNSQPAKQEEPEPLAPEPVDEAITPVIIPAPAALPPVIADQQPEEQPQQAAEPVIPEVAPQPVAAAPEYKPEPVATPPVAEAPVPSIDLGGQQDTYSYIRETPAPAAGHTFSISSSSVTEEPVAPVAGISALGTAMQAEPPKPVAATESVSQPETRKEEPAVLTLNQRLSAQRGGGHVPTVSSPAKPIGDLKSAISLNDKLMFVKDLFKGYNLAYNEAVELLNRCKTFDEADRLLKANYVNQNNWAAKQAAADKFYALLHRKFAQ